MSFNSDRRTFIQWLIASSLLSSSNVIATTKKPPDIRMAAIQMQPKIADVEYNLAHVDQLIQQAIKQKAEWIILPEMFTTAAGFHPGMLDAIQPHDGKPLQLMKHHAQQSNIIIGGSFLAQDGDDVYNRFYLVFPDGSVQQHNKDLPTYWENCFYKGGNDDGILSTPIGNIGSALCWEFIRSQTTQRLKHKVNMVVGGSCWWTLPEDASSESPYWKDNATMLHEAAPTMAKQLGVPVVNASHCGDFNAFYSPDLEDVAYNSSYLGDTMIVDKYGTILANRTQQQGAGVVIANIKLDSINVNTQTIPDRFWLPKEMPQPWKDSWIRWFDRGQDYYSMVTKPYLKTGKLIEYIPEYMR